MNHTKATPDNLFSSGRVAAGYARSRPAVHPHVIELVRAHLRIVKKAARALDVGCGAGLSTAPLSSIAEHSIGIDPFIDMVRWGSRVAPHAAFVAASAEALPVKPHTIDLITAAGSLNYADLSLFFPEAERVLTPRGTLVIYDFGQGRQFRDSDRLAEWFRRFEDRYPLAPAQEIDPARLDVTRYGFRMSAHEAFEAGLMLTPEFYLEYLMTESNVEDAISRGDSEDDIRGWCRRTLAPVFAGVPHEVLFRGYIAYVVTSR